MFLFFDWELPNPAFCNFEVKNLGAIFQSHVETVFVYHPYTKHTISKIQKTASSWQKVLAPKFLS